MLPSAPSSGYRTLPLLIVYFASKNSLTAIVVIIVEHVVPCAVIRAQRNG